MKAVVYCFSKPVPGSTVASSRIATFLAETIGAELCCDESIAHVEADVLFIVNGAFAFSDTLAQVAEAIRKAKRVVWVQNDYTIVPPKSVGNAKSPFRKAFVDREKDGLPGIDYWTTIDRNAHATKLSTYINWNQLTWEPQPIQDKYSKTLFYYGAFRNHRKIYFDRYFEEWNEGHTLNVVISSKSRKFEEFYRDSASVIPGLEREGFYQALGRHGLGLYIEDPASHNEGMSPANRFYEMLSAGLPMVFQPESVRQLYLVGIDVTEWVVNEPKDMDKFFLQRKRIAQRQRQLWSGDFVTELRKQVTKAYKALTKEVK